MRTPLQVSAHERALRDARNACSNEPDVMAPFGAMRMFDRNGLKAEIIAVRASEMTEYQVRR